MMAITLCNLIWNITHLTWHCCLSTLNSSHARKTKCCATGIEDKKDSTMVWRYNVLMLCGFTEYGLLRFLHSLHTLKSQGSASSLLMLVTHCRHDDIHSSRSCAYLCPFKMMFDGWSALTVRHWCDETNMHRASSFPPPSFLYRRAKNKKNSHRAHTDAQRTEITHHHGYKSITLWLHIHKTEILYTRQCLQHALKAIDDCCFYFAIITCVFFPLYFPPSLTFSIFWIIQCLFSSRSPFAQPSAVANLHTPTQGHVVMCK